MQEKYKIGIDIGASHIGCGVLNKEGKIIEKIYIIDNIDGNKELLIEGLKSGIYRVLEKANIKIEQVEKIGIGCPGDCDLEKGILLIAPNLHIKNVNIKEELMKEFKNLIVIQNDATCALLGEYYFGSLANVNENIIFITLGTGVGFAQIDKNGNTQGIEKCNTLAGIFRNSIDGENSVHNSGSLGELCETYSDLKGTEKLRRRQIFIDAINEDKMAMQVLNEYINKIEKGIVSLSKETGIKHFCIGGGISEYKQLFFNKIKKDLNQLNIYVSKNENDAAIIGATLV